MSNRCDDKIALQDLLSDYWARTDHLVEELATDLFTDDGEILIGTLERRGREEIHAYATDRRASEDATGRRTRHATSNVRVMLDDGDPDLAQVRFLLMVFAGRGAMPLASTPPSNVADFAATCRRIEGRWRIASLRGQVIFAGAEAPPNGR